MTEAPSYKPEQLIKDAAKHGELVVFVGAGASKLCGSPDWTGFASQVVGELENGGVLSFLEAEQLRSLGDPRRTLSIAMALAEKHGLSLGFDRILHPAKPSAIGIELYALLSSLRPVFVTTNYDKWLDDAGPDELSSESKPGSESEPAVRPTSRPKYYLPEHLSPALLAERGAVIHLHGSYTEPSSMVVSLRDYVEHYADRRVQAFLSAMFKNYTVLFVGYGLAEIEVLEHIIRSNESLRAGPADPRHFLLYAHRSTESVQTRFIEDFFRDQCGVHVIRYRIDAKGYSELVDVFKGWSAELDVRDPTTLDLQAHLDGYIASATQDDRDAAIRLVSRWPELTSYFMNSLKEVIWFSDLDRAGFFDAKHSPGVKRVEMENGTTAYQADGWPALRYLEDIAPIVQGEQAARVANIIRAISSDAERRDVDNWRTRWSLATTLSRLPLEVIEDGDIDMVRFLLSSRFEGNMAGQELGKHLLPRLLESSNQDDLRKAVSLVDALSMTRPKVAKGEKAGVMDSYHLREALKASTRRFGERGSTAAIELLARRLTEYIGTRKDDRHSYIWRAAIEEHEQDAHHEDNRAVLVDALRDAALGATSVQSPESLAVAENLLQSPYPTLVRIGIFVCGEHYGNVGDAFWACAKANWFIDIPYWHELYWFIKKAFNRFSATERAQFLEFVDRLKGDWSDESRQEEWDETHKRDLLFPATGQGDSQVDEWYRSLEQRWGPVRDHPDFHSYTSSGWVGERSPIASDALVGMSDEELVRFLTNFVPDKRSFDGPTYRGLATTISAAVRASEDGFGQRIALFADLARPYQHGLLRGLKERWSDDKRDINWPATLSLMNAIVSSPTFKADLKAKPPEGWEPSIHWVVTDIAEVLRAGFAVDRPLPLELLKPSLEVLQLVLKQMTPAKAEEPEDAVSHAINSSRGRTVESLIHLALAMRREEIASGCKSGETWAAIRHVFDAELESSEFGENAEFAALAGMYCANLHYINAEWVEANFDRLFSSSNSAAWKCAAQGFAYQRYMYDWLFNKLVAGGHLRRMVYSEGLPSHVAEKALQFLALAYLEGIEGLEGDGLLAELVATLRVKELSQVCWFFWTLRTEGDTSPHAPKILAFWLKVVERIRGAKADVPELHSALIQLAVFIGELTMPLVEALIEAAPHADSSHHGYLLVENLARLASHYPKEVAAIFRAAIAGFLPTYQKEDVIRCVQSLAEAGEAEDAMNICNDYAVRGSTLLKETYETLRRQGRQLN